jgi:uncharacterized protein YodC (DUF2158 family)
MANGYQEGDTVQLKSGGPGMTIQKFEADRAYCIWFDGDGKKQGASFPLSTLQHAK